MSRFQLLATASAVTLITASGAASGARPVNLAEVFDPEMINADLPYFEQVTGPARNTYGDTKYYKVGDCVVQVKLAEGTIRSLSMQLSPKCTFDVNRFLPSHAGKFPPSHALTFGAFDTLTSGTGEFYANCLSLCGNAFLPVIYEYWQGARSDNQLEIMLEAGEFSNHALGAKDTWEAALGRVRDEKWVIDATLICSRKYDESVRRAFRDVTIGVITIGYDIQVPGCDR